jgi:hypothetical protein
MKYTLLVLGLFVGISTLAQQPRPASRSKKMYEMSGRILDSLTGNPLVGAVLKLNFDKIGLTTNAKGEFSLFLPEAEYVVSISYVGYRPFRLRFTHDNDRVFNLKLLSVAQEIEEVVISTQAVDDNVSRPLLGVSQMNIKTIKRLPAIMGETDVLRSLQMMPGVTSVGEASNGVNIRGGTVDQNLILLDPLVWSVFGLSARCHFGYGFIQRCYASSLRR